MQRSPENSAVSVFVALVCPKPQNPPLSCFASCPRRAFCLSAVAFLPASVLACLCLILFLGLFPPSLLVIRPARSLWARREAWRRPSSAAVGGEDSVCQHRPRVLNTPSGPPSKTSAHPLVRSPEQLRKPDRAKVGAVSAHQADANHFRPSPSTQVLGRQAHPTLNYPCPTPHPPHPTPRPPSPTPHPPIPHPQPITPPHPHPSAPRRTQPKAKLDLLGDDSVEQAEVTVQEPAKEEEDEKTRVLRKLQVVMDTVSSPSELDAVIQHAEAVLHCEGRPRWLHAARFPWRRGVGDFPTGLDSHIQAARASRSSAAVRCPGAARTAPDLSPSQVPEMRARASPVSVRFPDASRGGTPSPADWPGRGGPLGSAPLEHLNACTQGPPRAYGPVRSPFSAQRANSGVETGPRAYVLSPDPRPGSKGSDAVGATGPFRGGRAERGRPGPLPPTSRGRC